MSREAAKGVLFRSSRGGGGTVSFREALLAGLAPDGGLFVPVEVPALPEGWQQARSLTELGVLVLSAWLAEPDGSQLAEVLGDALELPVPVVELPEDKWVVELFHGPTLSFKDFGARVMARLMDHYLAESGGRVTILTATSGDTGSAVADGFSGLDNIEVVLLYPRGLVSDVQERQLLHARQGVRAIAVEGTFDDCQRLVKQAFQDPGLAALNLSSANSINVGRLVPQQLYYLWAHLRLQERGVSGEDTVYVVPSGNLGNLTAGLLALRGGMPASRFVAAHNANDYFPNYLLGRTRAFDYPATRATLSNAMDVGAPSNFERLHSLFDGDLTRMVWAVSVSDEATRQRIAAALEEDGYLACPHTAVGLEALARRREVTGRRDPAVVLATAHPAKFPSVIREATGVEVTDERLERLTSNLAQPIACSADYDSFLELLEAELGN